ncbi:PaaX family transcriptional regulator [Microbacterium sp. dk485]|uniref:PaaX family transcriptional regulator n=1 Tax=Microbacterium sp. dk485 TaxID=2560021 RepID=UPI001072F81F|nr:PaaX family transcriptional regulator C-terminal domain-containing protein [Microbacterium sp. dk485]TFV84056.1 PaaX family transcriptional regulator [Microbacterium sp. dk485]
MDSLPPGPRLPRSTTSREPQYLIVTLLGDYWFRRSEQIPSAAIVALLAEFGITESGARQAMRRLHKRGLLTQGKSGRTTSYGAPERMSESAEATMRRVLRFGLDITGWDGLWTVVTFSIPEPARDVRRVLRTRLRDLGFGLLNDANWITPHDRTIEAVELLDTLQVDDGSVLRATIVARPGRPFSVADVFDLETLERRYLDFIARHEPKVQEVLAGGVPPRDALVMRTEIMTEWLQFRQFDPDLPVELLPDGWPRARAREVAFRIYDELGVAAEARFRQVLGAVDRDLAALSSHHTSRDA